MPERTGLTIGHRSLPGNLSIPEAAHGLVIFAHGSGSSRLSPRNIHVADRLNASRLGTLLFDLLTPDEAADRRNVFDVELLGGRVVEAIDAVRKLPTTKEFRVGLFGASTGAAASLVAAAVRPRDIAAVVSRGGRPDLAMAVLDRVKAPTLLVVGGDDPEVVELNRAAFARLAVAKSLEIVPGATHLFEEPGALDRVVALAAAWFNNYLKPASN
jgi:dienelactone hydrolase